MSDFTPEEEQNAEVELNDLSDASIADLDEFVAELEPASKEAPAPAATEDGVEEPVVAKPARKAARKSTRKKPAKASEPEPEKSEDDGDEESPSLDPFAADLRTTGPFHTDEEFVVVVNTNPYAVTVNCQGQILAGYSRAVVSSQDPVTRRAIEKGILLVPSGQ